MEGVPVTVEKGERVELVMRNTTMMAHPMHMHGPSFQVTEINGQRLRRCGARRRPGAATHDSEGRVRCRQSRHMGLHCHNLYHMAAGMFATVVYRGFN